MPGETGLTIDLSEFNRNLQALRLRNATEAPRMVRDVGHALISAAQGRVPIDSGDLKGSGKVVDHGKPLSVEIGFNEEYAAAVHERLDVTHEQGQAKYLEAAIREDGPEIFRKAAAEYARRMGAN